MPRLLLLACCLCACARADIVERRFDSAALNSPMDYSLYLPPGYSATPANPYPVVYLLHGVGDNHRAWVKLGKAEATADRLIASGNIPPLLLVIPDTKTSWLVDSADVSGPGDYATAVRHDLVAHVDSRYPTLAARRGRAIAGLSMGGFGALRLAFERPDIYAATAGLSSALWSRLRDDSVLTPRQEKIFQGSFGTPFDAARFRRQSPAALFDSVSRFNQTQQTPLGIFLSAGDDDYFRAYISTFNFFLALREAGIDAELRITDGGHLWPVWAATLDPVLRFFAAEFNRLGSPAHGR